MSDADRDDDQGPAVPLTFLAHQAPVLPLKWGRPRRWDGTALVIGSMAPDFAYLTHGTPWYVDAHGIAAQLWFCLPLTVALTWVFKRRVVGVLAPHLPDEDRFGFHFRDYRLLATWPGLRGIRSWLAVAAGALVGSCSHLVLDTVAHRYAPDSPAHRLLPPPGVVLPGILHGRSFSAHDGLQALLSVLGAAVSVWCLRRIGRQRALRGWYPDPGCALPTGRSRRILRRWTLAGAATGLVVATLAVGVGALQDSVIRFAELALAGVLVGCLRARAHMTAAADVHPPVARV